MGKKLAKAKKPMIVIKLNPNKVIGFRETSVGPGGKETIIRENNFVIRKQK